MTIISKEIQVLADNWTNNKTDANFLLLHTELHPLIQRYIKRFLKSSYKSSTVSLSEDSDLVQEVFVRIFTKITSYEEKHFDQPKYTFLNWIYKITRNVCVDNLRKTKRLAETPLYWDEDSDDSIRTDPINPRSYLYEEPESDETFKIEENIFNLDDGIDILYECIDQLPDEDKYLITEYYLNKQSLKYIAYELNTTTTALKSRNFKIRNKLRLMIKVRLDEDTDFFD